MDTANRRELKNLLRRGEDALLRHDYERASTYFRRAYTTDPGNITAITNLGYVYARMGRFSHAQKCFITALDIDPDNQVARKNLSLLMSPEKERRPPSSPQVRGRPAEEIFLRYLEWGNLQMKQGNYYAAIQYFKQASRIHPDFIEPHLKIGLSYEELQEWAAAAGAFTDALDIFPKDPIALEHLDKCRGMNNDDSQRNSENEASIESSTKAMDEVRQKSEEYNQPPDLLQKMEMPTTSDKTPSKTEDLAPEKPKSEDDVIRAILNQYSDLISSGKSSDKGQKDQTGEHIPEEEKPGTSEPPVTPVVSKKQPPVSSDDMVSSILMQYQDDIADESQSTSPASEPESSDKGQKNQTGEHIPEEEKPETSEPPVTPVVSKKQPPVSSDDMVSSILMQYQDDIADESQPTPPASETASSEKDQVPYTGDAPLSGEKMDINQAQSSGIRVDLNDNQKDALRELGNIGASHAATTLSTMLNTPIMLNVPEINITDFEHINTEIAQENSAMAIFTMEGQMAKAGYVILHVPRESVVLMTGIMLGMPDDPGRELNEMDESAITEIGNIMVSAFLDGTAELLGIIMLPSPPRTIFDLPKKVFDLIIAESNIRYDNVVFFRTELICDEHELNLNIFMLPNPPVLQEIVRMLEKIIEDSAQGK
ncbi:chemotaxis protein CheC [Methanospirillum lacunae]|uniref:CheC-like protein domain-containing protein n=1 Tax=Methanospirillum lacunae TaxID=668570 RepID=A0A2V2N2L6_9EURY|nr:chemotaxis protein CheC [Methanospirillum lacunae]PWR72785.1 hypothetical protein DK846_07490 [Methanospirillum lacunae]